jgi:hypothetical protein
MPDNEPDDNALNDAPDMPEDDDIFAHDAVLGDYVSHHPSNRNRLLIRGAIFYGVPIVFLQFFFAELDDTLASIVLVALYAILAWIVAWYVLHNWNREVIIYERGFTYREGSQTAVLYYSDIITFQQRAEQLAYLGIIKRNVYEFTLITGKDERIVLNATYQDIAKLGDTLEKRVAEARQPIVEALLEAGERLGFGVLVMSSEGLQVGDVHLAWADYGHYSAEAGDLVFYTKGDSEGLRVRLAQLDNLFLLVRMLKARHS